MIETAWKSAFDKVASKPVAEGDFLLFRVNEELHHDFYGGIDCSGRLLLAVGVSFRPPVVEIESDALDCFTHHRKVSDSWLIVLRLKRPELRAVFARLCQDLIDESIGAGDEAGMLVLVRNRLTLWQKLFEDRPDGLLAEFQVKGLLAELLFLKRTLDDADRSVDEILHGWVGPQKADQDFQFSDEAIEVKAIGMNSEGVKISSLNQLKSMVPLRLSIWTMRPTSQDEAGAVTLNSIVRTIQAQLHDSSGAVQNFRKSLLESGYVEHEHYDHVAFQVIGTENFPVGNDFPKLTLDDVPRGIASANYVISMHHIRNQPKD